MKKLIFASHGELAAGLKSAVKLICGDMADDIITFGLEPGDSADRFVAEVQTMIEEQPKQQYIILTDLKGASVCNAFTTLADTENVYVFSGMNLALGLELTIIPKLQTNKEAQAIAERAAAGVELIELPKNIENEDF